MGIWDYRAQYRLYLKKGNGTVYSLTTLQSVQAVLTTTQGVNQATITLGDAAGDLRRTVQPRPMNVVELWLQNRFGEWGIAFTGYVDAARKAFDPTQGDSVTLTVTGPVKLFEITRQTPGDAGALAIAYAQNITGSAVLTYAAKQVGYPASMLRIHPVADSGSGLQQINAAVFTQADQQPWSAVVSTIQANSGIEWFFDERGYCYWRQVGFLQPWFGSDPWRPPALVAHGGQQLTPRVIAQDDIVQADFAESDQGVVTQVQVRYYGNGGIFQTAAVWSAPPSMAAHLRTRLLVVYAPWIAGYDAAYYLAGVLGAQYAAGVATANVTIPADPLVGIGSLVRVPALGIDGTTVYYVSSVTYQLTWGGQWVMTLGLSYGRSGKESFPYVHNVAYPVLTDNIKGQFVPFADTVQSLDAANPAWDLTPYHLTTAPGIGAGVALTGAYQPGATIQIYSKPRSKGALVGHAPSGEYVVAAPPAGQPPHTIALPSTAGSAGYTGFVTIIDPGTDLSNSANMNAGTGGTTTNGYSASNAGTGDNPGGITGTAAAILNPGSAPLAALQQAQQYQGLRYILGHAGPDGYDCSGLIAAAYHNVGLDALILLNGGGFYNTDIGPPGIYQYFKSKGAHDIAVSAAQKGDLLFINNGGAFQGGFVHVAFALGNGQNFGANNPTMGIGVSNIAGYVSDTPTGPPTGFNGALDMSTVHLGTR